MWKVEDPHLAIAAFRSKTRTDLLACVTKKIQHINLPTVFQMIEQKILSTPSPSPSHLPLPFLIQMSLLIYTFCNNLATYITPKKK
jgi:hypothetical protein